MSSIIPIGAEPSETPQTMLFPKVVSCPTIPLSKVALGSEGQLYGNWLPACSILNIAFPPPFHLFSNFSSYFPIFMPFYAQFSIPSSSTIFIYHPQKVSRHLFSQLKNLY